VLLPEDGGQPPEHTGEETLFYTKFVCVNCSFCNKGKVHPITGHEGPEVK
jgi:hypothetical protein